MEKIGIPNIDTIDQCALARAFFVRASEDFVATLDGLTYFKEFPIERIVLKC